MGLELLKLLNLLQTQILSLETRLHLLQRLPTFALHEVGLALEPHSDACVPSKALRGVVASDLIIVKFGLS